METAMTVRKALLDGFASVMISPTRQAVANIQPAHQIDAIDRVTTGAQATAQHWYKTGERMRQASKTIERQSQRQPVDMS
jgi:hypothetical protein